VTGVTSVTDFSNAFLGRAKLCGAYPVTHIRFVEADMEGADLTGASLTWSDLQKASILRMATMPDKGRYDGRLNLQYEIECAASGRFGNLDTNNAQAMADYYEVPVQEYLAGQAWTREQLPR
jgi:uncharacterized protein YjbI with pentapeptide repeats